MGDQDQFFKRIAIATLVVNTLAVIVAIVGIFCTFYLAKPPGLPASQATQSQSTNLPIDSGHPETGSSPESTQKQFWGDDTVSLAFRAFFSHPLFWIPAMLLLVALSQILGRWRTRLSQSGHASRRE